MHGVRIIKLHVFFPKIVSRCLYSGFVDVASDSAGYIDGLVVATTK